ncbi:hypothetical protein ABXT43_02215 [Candidatus Pelagibacter sp. Uisw_114]
MHKTIVIPVIILGNRRVKPSALFAKLFEVTPRTTARIRNPYEVVRTHSPTLNEISLNIYNYLDATTNPLHGRYQQ